MQSGELAGLAGVSVRALRHYHQVGILPEPARRANGYRTYDVEDLVRVLRIKRLSSLGVPLERMTGLLDGPDGSGDTHSGVADSILDDLDRELADQIAGLREQRAAIAHLRTHRSSPDIPPELARYFAAYADAGVPADVARADRDGSVLLTHLVGADGMAELATFYERLSDPAIISSVVALIEEFGRLGTGDAGDTSEGIADLVDRFSAIVAQAFDDVPDPDPPIELGSSGRLLGELVEGRLNERQRQAVALLSERLSTRR
ncbi:MerR family transcriptional regulator [Gordonia sp. NPDC058843]|uniref:MerR family transcriptional regulator n=1 Tax=Gordonia sp. NPDC058843 TaxID=3346648 RepID=UPI0036892115